MKFTGLENSNPDTVARARMVVAHAARDCSRAHLSALALPCPSGHAQAPRRPHLPASGPLPRRVPSSTPDAWRHPTDPFPTSACHLKRAPPIAAPFFLSLPHSLPFSSKTEPPIPLASCPRRLLGTALPVPPTLVLPQGTTLSFYAYLLCSFFSYTD
jgi:hypothetical protein